ncbi:glyceraldehyde-3-phosphate dehydrogenase, type I [Paenibacillus curdlanolyticus YK9]|uniref:Glyceraldehyde-3-phosphate dehydrogenase n=1 Tax=Paenibacillus curdlanolyticus YK9 TaxID=717606 RepID=E0I6D5_9BACL|nr:type I glyceraldehyde-3-phosphate dehydrogenase [Paenibacillus curdlanolyticus]EFM11601.1 glyceraldehyde-3-phosphate dehydrogenase, type I [Paenibacillus curdlanolyticus YK9]
MTTKVGINGFGRIGRNVFRAAFNRDDVEIVAVNDLTNAETMAHLLKYDSIQGEFHADVEAKDGNLYVNGKEVKVFAEREPANLPWSNYGVELVIESTGRFNDKKTAEAHITSGGAKKVIISAPSKNEDITVVLGVNEDKYNPAMHDVVSNASCTTNCLAPLVKVIHDKFGIKHGLMTTIHSYTNDQPALDTPHSDLRRARSAALSIIPTTTGAAKAMGLVMPELNGKIHGYSMRVPTPVVSAVDFSFEVSREVTVDDINSALKEAAEGPLKGILGYSELPLVSKDYLGNQLSSVIDALSTMVIDGTMVKVVSWFDNEWGYSNRVVDLTAYMAEKGL